MRTCSTSTSRARPGREVADRDLQPGLLRQGGQPQLPRAGPVAVGAARVRGDQQPPGPRVLAAASGVPPAADRLHRERGGVMVGAHVHPARVRRHVIEPVGNGLACAVAREIMRADSRRLTPGPPLPARVLELPDQLLLLGVHADHRVAAVLVGPGLLADVAGLGVPVRVLVPLDGLGVALQAEPLRAQQVAHGIGADLMALAGQLIREIASRLGRPPQRRHRIALLVRLDLWGSITESGLVRLPGWDHR